MQMDQFENMNIEQLQHIKYLMIVMKKNSKKFEDLDSEFLNKYLTNEEIILFYKALCMYYKNKPKVNEPKLFWDEYNPYKVLGVSEKEYTKEELLNILKCSMNELKLEKNKQKRKILTDKILDAYNDIINKRV